MPEEGGAATTRVEVRPTRRGSCPGGCRVSAPQGRGTAIPAPGLASKPLPERLTPGRVPSRAALPVWTTTRPPPAPPPGAEERRPPVWAPGLAIEGRAPPTPLAGRPQAALPAGPRRAARGSARGPAPDLRRPLCGTPSPTVARLAHASRFLPRRRRLARRAPRNASDPLKVRAAPGICRAPGSADPCCTARRSLRRGAAAAALPGGYRSPVAGAARPLSLQVSADAVPAVPGHPSRRAERRGSSVTFSFVAVPRSVRGRCSPWGQPLFSFSFSWCSAARKPNARQVRAGSGAPWVGMARRLRGAERHGSANERL